MQNKIDNCQHLNEVTQTEACTDIDGNVDTLTFCPDCESFDLLSCDPKGKTNE